MDNIIMLDNMTDMRGKIYRNAFLFTFLAVLLLFSPCAWAKSDAQWYKEAGHRSDKWDNLAESGMESFDAQSYATAYLLLKKAYDLGCRDPLVTMKIGFQEEAAGKYEDAFAHLSESAQSFDRMYPAHAEAKRISFHAARAAFMANKFDAAKLNIEKALAASGDDVNFLMIAAQIYGKLGEWKLAVLQLDKAKGKIAANAPMAEKIAVNRMLAIAYYKLDSLDQAQAIVDDILRSNPGDQIALEYRRLISERRQKIKEEEVIRRITQ